jgi:hypothetical protein
MLIMGCIHCIKCIKAAIAKKEVDIYSPPPGDIPHGIEDSFGDDNLFFQLISEHLLCLSRWDGDTGATHFGLKLRILAKQNLFSCVQSLN